MADHQGIAKAQYLVGSSFKDGIWVSKSYKKAFYYYKLAADQGLGQAQITCLAYIIRVSAVEQDPIKPFISQIAADQWGTLSLSYY